MRRYKVTCRIDGEEIEKYIICREMTINHNSYSFWTGEIGATNRLAWAFPIMFTIVEGLPDTETN
jgi:hypothetical protein